MTTAKNFRSFLMIAACSFVSFIANAQGTRLLRQPDINTTQVVFVYAGDIWIADKNGGDARRITSTAAVEANPHFSPDGQWIAFNSDRSGVQQVYVVSAQGGTPTRLTWYPSASLARGWNPDGKNVLYASGRENAPTPFNRLWSVSVKGGPSVMLPAPWGFDANYSPDGNKLLVDRMSRWDVEFRHYRGGQNTALQILDLKTLEEKDLPWEGSMDRNPHWLNDEVFFVSDRDFIANVWGYNPSNGKLRQVTKHTSGDVKALEGNGKELVYEQNGYLHLLDPSTGKSKQLNINVVGDFPWAETKTENVTTRATSAALSPTGKRIILEARGDIYTVPVENGDPRNITQSSGAADRRPLWSPDGKDLAWFSDKDGKDYALYITDQDASKEPRKISLGDSKLAWSATWSPNGKYIAFTDNQVRVQVLDVASGNITTADVGGNNLDRGNMDLTWSSDSKFLAYAKSQPNNFRSIMVWSVDTKKATQLTDPLADAVSPVWDLNNRYLYFLASTNYALGSGWANTSSQQARQTFGAYITLLRKEEANPFPLKSDEEPDTTRKPVTKDTSSFKGVRIDFDQIDRRIIAMPIPVADYNGLLTGPKGSFFLITGSGGLNKYTVAEKKTDPFIPFGSSYNVTSNGEKLLYRAGPAWKVIATARPPQPTDGNVNFQLRTELNRSEEWKQIFYEAWRYQKDYFYDRNMHGRDWNEVWEQYAPLVPYIKHRSDLTYLLDQLGGETSVGHSFVSGGDFPAVDTSRGGVLGADLIADGGRWKIKKILTAESWNPGLVAPLAQPNMKLKEGDYIIAINNKTLTDDTDPYQLLNGTAGLQTVLTVNNKPSADGAWQIVVQSISSEAGLRQQNWIEDNRRKVDQLSNGKLGYVWVPNTGGPGFNSFNRYYFAQQNKQGAVIDERFNGGGLLDDYMVDLMVRRLRAGLTNEVPGGEPFRLPAGILGPKVLLINELAGSGGDFFPWIFKQQKVGPLVGTRTWGGLVKASTHYAFIDNGSMTSPDNAVFDPFTRTWVAENKGVSPDIEQKITAKAVAAGRDLQLERAVEETLKLLQKEPWPEVKKPAYSTPAKK